MVSGQTLRFTAQQVGAREAIEMIRSEPGSLLRRGSETKVPFDQWVLKAPPGTRAAVARVTQAISDNELANDGAPLATAHLDHASLHPDFVASLTEVEALSLGLPPAARLALNLQSVGIAHQDNFSIEARWTRPNGLPALVQSSGSRLKHQGSEWRIADPIWSALQLVERLNAAADQSERQAALAALRQAIGDDDRTFIRPDGFIERLRLSYAAGFSLALKPSAAGFDFDPILFSPDRMRETDAGLVLDEAADSLLPPKQQESFAKAFRRGDGGKAAYLLDGGSILYLDRALNEALKVVHDAQAGTAEERRDFARSPQRRISEALADRGMEHAATTLFVETQQFSERVSGIDIWRKPVLPWIKPKPNSWLPEAFGLRVGDPPDDQLVELRSEQLDEALAAVEAAIENEQPTVVINDAQVPANEQTRAALADLAALATEAADHDADGGPPPVACHRYFLQVRDNLEDVAYAPLAAAPASKSSEQPTFPAAMKSQPKPHQVDGFAWLSSCWRAGMPGALLADDMGLGKTFQALAFLAWLRAQEPNPKPVLIVAPTGLLANWKAEIAQHLLPDTLGPVVSAYGAGLNYARDEQGRDIELGRSVIDNDAWAQAGVILTTFETMRDYHLSFARRPFAAIIYDEVQKLKNPASQMTRAAKTLNARFQLAMTGTPVENRLQDLWSIFDVVHPGLLGSSKAFESAYPASDLDKLRELNAVLTEPQSQRPPLLLRRMKDDCLPGLPAKHIHALPGEMPEPQASAYDQVVQRAMAARGSGKRGHMLEILHRLRGISLHPVAPEDAGQDYFEHSARLRALFTTLDAIKAKGEKALVFCESLAMQALLAAEFRHRYLLDHDVARIHGGVTGDARQLAVDQFQHRGPGFDVMILSPKAGGVGLTLTAANHVIHLSRWWNPAVEDQATDRVFRIGQQRDVHVYLPQSVHPSPALKDSSFDLKLDALMRRKRDLSRGLLVPGDDDSDTGALFDEIFGSAGEDEQPAEPIANEAEPPEQPTTFEPVNDVPPPSRPTLTLGQTARPAPARTAGPRRHIFEANGLRDFTIFRAPLDGEHVTQLNIRDPYASSKGQYRDFLIGFVKILMSAAKRIDAVSCFTLDAEGTQSWDTDNDIRDDLERRWAKTIGATPTLRLTLISKRQDKNFHAREVEAVTASGRKIIWDLDNGVDGVMKPGKRCIVGCFESD